MWVRAVLAILLVVPAGLAQSVQFVDSENDVRMSTANGALRNRAGGDLWTNLDILSGGVFSETDDELVFFINLTTLETQQYPPLPKSQPTYTFYFDYGERSYRIVGQTDLTSPWDAALGAPALQATLEVAYGDDVYHPLAEAGLTLDTDNDQVLFHVDRRDIRDHNEAPLGRGEDLTGFMAESRSLGWFGVPIVLGENYRVEVGPPQYGDVAPDLGRRGATYRTVAGEQLHGGALLASSLDPVRWTNGEATTFVFLVRVANTGSQEMDVVLGHEGADPSWQIAFTDRLTIPAHTAINVTFHVGIPFGHFHGKLHDFHVTFESVKGNHWAKQPLAVYWPEIPQPAGHHPELWFHSRLQPRQTPFETLGDRVHGWLSAADPDVEQLDEQRPVPADRIRPPTDDGRVQAEWEMRVEPSLRMGLDFVLDEVGQGQVAMHFPMPVQDPVLELEILHQDRRTIIPRGTMAITSSAALEGSQEGDVVFDFPELQALEAADLILHSHRADLVFRMNLTGVMVGNGVENPEEFTPTLLPGPSTFTLPLQEYHDPLATVFRTDASVNVIVGEEGQEKKVNAGEQVVFTAILLYQGTFTSGFEVELSGKNAEWARVLGDPHFEIEPDGARDLAIAIQPPPGTPDGERAEVTVKVIGSVNAAVQAGFIVRADVVGQDVADETEQADLLSQQLTTPPAASRTVWPWFVFPPLAIIGAGIGVVAKLRPDWILFWR